MATQQGEDLDLRDRRLSVIDLTEGPAPRLLVVDDDPDVRAWLRIALELQGWVVEEASTAEEALEMVGRVPPDLVILDHHLPGATGLGCARILRERHPGMSLVMFSAYLDRIQETEADLLELETISKVDHDSLLRYLSAHLEALTERTTGRLGTETPSRSTRR
jgi:two-component system phosphate regulon response regulator OmpR